MLDKIDFVTLLAIAVLAITAALTVPVSAQQKGDVGGVFFVCKTPVAVQEVMTQHLMAPEGKSLPSLVAEHKDCSDFKTPVFNPMTGQMILQYRPQRATLDKIVSSFIVSDRPIDIWKIEEFGGAYVPLDGKGQSS